MKSSKYAKSLGLNAHGDKLISTTQTLVGKGTISPRKQAAEKSYRRAITPLPPKLVSGIGRASRPQTSLGLYNEKDGTFDIASNISRPNSAFGSNTSPNVYKISRAKTQSKGKSTNKSNKSSQKSKKAPTKARVVWEDNTTQNAQTADGDTSTNSTDLNKPRLNDPEGEGSISRTWTKSSVDRGRSTLPRRRTGFNAGALIPGSVSTMVSLPESDEDQTATTLASPSFQSVLNSDNSSEYETDLEEDFPVTKKGFDPSGRNVYHKLCKEEDLVPVSFLSDRFTCKEVVMRHHGLGSHGTYPIARALIKNTFIEKLDLTDNYIEAGGGVALARMLLDNCFITEIITGHPWKMSTEQSAVSLSGADLRGNSITPISISFHPFRTL